MKDLAIIIPCRNEGVSILNILRRLKKNYIILINDASTNNTLKKIIKSKKLNIITNSKKIGYEGSIIKGIKIIKKKYNSNIKYILTMDADGDHNPYYVRKIYNKIKKLNCDLIIGNRTKKNRKSEELISNLFMKKYNLKDPLSGFKIYKKKKLYKVVSECTKKYFLVDLCILFLKHHFKIVNMSINTKKNSSRRPRVNQKTVNKKILSIKNLI